MSLKPPALMPIFCQKNGNSVKTTLLGPNKVNCMPFFPIFHEKSILSCPYFVKDNPFSRKLIGLITIFRRQYVYSLKKHGALIFLFSNFV